MVGNCRLVFHHFRGPSFPSRFSLASADETPFSFHLSEIATFRLVAFMLPVEQHTPSRASVHTSVFALLPRGEMRCQFHAILKRPDQSGCTHSRSFSSLDRIEKQCGVPPRSSISHRAVPELGAGNAEAGDARNRLRPGNEDHDPQHTRSRAEVTGTAAGKSGRSDG